MKRLSPGVASASLNEESAEIASNLEECNIKYFHLLYDDQKFFDDGSLIRQALRSGEVRSWLIELAKRGYYIYMSNAEGSRFCHEDRLPHLWQQYTSGNLSISSKGIFYNIVGSERTRRPSTVFVIFCAMGNDMFTHSLNRFYVRNYQHLQSAVGADSWIIRIPDVGGVLGSFYLPTRYKPSNASDIQALLSSILEETGVSSDRMVLVGSSKGGTGATFHSLSLGTSLISVDPILEDTYYERQHMDCHFTNGGVFTDDKRTVFDRFDDSINDKDGAYRVALTSRNSPQYPTVSTFFERMGVPLLTNNSSEITDHPDVAKVTHRIVMSLCTSLVAEMPLPEADQLVR